ncbi:MAG: ATP-binding cassette domain-containing protein [Minisyncoccia bacterium]
MEDIEIDLENNQKELTEVIQVENLKKNYNSFTALKGISFTVKKGEIFGFLGPNGAGKTTTINILSTLILPTSGVVFVNGFNVLTRPDMVRRSIGLVFQETTLDTHLTAEENLYLHAYLYGVRKKEFSQRKREVLKLCELWDKRKWRVENFSGGMKRRLEIARALIHWPKILFLDEPTVGLDPQTRTKIWDYIFTTRKQKDTTVFLTTQYLNEAENCNRIAILDHGEIVALDTPENLKKMVGGDIITLKTLDNDLAEKEFKEKFPQYKLRRLGKELKIEVENGDEFLPTLVKTITPKIISVELRRPTLEDVFLEVTGRKIREEEEFEEQEEPFNLASLFSLFNNHKKKKENI